MGVSRLLLLSGLNLASMTVAGEMSRPQKVPRFPLVDPDAKCSLFKIFVFLLLQNFKSPLHVSPIGSTVAKMEVLCFRLPGHGDDTLKSMNSLRSRQQFCDITIVASGRQTFRGHKVVLAACSPFLRDQFLLNPSSELQVGARESHCVTHYLGYV